MDTKALKDKILQLAIQGKLVPQDENDEPASVLLERIKEEKEQLIKDKVIKKENPLPEISEDEKLFELPNGWEWCRLGEVIQINPRNKAEDELEASFVPMSLISDGYNDKHDYEIRIWNKIKSGFTHFAENDVAIAKITPCFENRKSSIMRGLKNGIGAGTTELYILRPYNNLILPQFIYNTIISKDFIEGGKATYTGTAGQQRVKKEFIINYIIAVPPLEEQKRIVAKVDSLFKLIDELDINKQDLLQNILYSRKKVLQLAIQGKLVPQDENDEPAYVLLEKIKEEKEQLTKDKVIKKEKPLPEITDDEKLFDLPNGWEWCRLSQISNYIKAGGDKPKDFSTVKSGEYKIPVIANGKTNTGIMGYTKIATENNKCITVSGRGTIGYSCIREEPFCPIVRLIVICPNSNIDISYLHYVLQYFIEEGVGTSVQQLTVPMITPKVIPLPPLEEQRRIVAKVDTIINYLDDLEKYIK